MKIYVFSLTQLMIFEIIFKALNFHQESLNPKRIFLFVQIYLGINLDMLSLNISGYWKHCIVMYRLYCIVIAKESKVSMHCRFRGILNKYRHGQLNPDSHSTMWVWIRLPMSVCDKIMSGYFYFSKNIWVLILIYNLWIFWGIEKITIINIH